MLDIALQDNLMFQDSGNQLYSLVLNFHNYVMALGMFVICGVLYFLMSSMYMPQYYSKFSDLPILEFWWTMFPMLMLFVMAVPSLSLLYKMDEILDPYLNMKSIGNQWYWTYEYDHSDEVIEINSYMISSKDLNFGDFSLSEVDNSMAVPVGTLVSLVTTSNDVIHCWTVPSLGVKIDSIPGSLNQMGFICESSGLFLGGCSEMCGSDHAYMPIVMESVSLNLFKNWINTLMNS